MLSGSATQTMRMRLVRTGFRFFSASYQSYPRHHTPLHAAIEKAQNTGEILALKKQYSPRELVRMALTVNNQGLMPQQLLGTTTRNYDIDVVYQMLLGLYHRQEVKPLQEKTCPDQLIQNEYPNDGLETKELIRLACLASNAARESIKYSSTHPDANQLSPDELYTLTRRIQHMQLLLKLSPTPDAIVSKTTQRGIANCAEFAFRAVHFLKYHCEKPLSVMLVKIQNGDHFFIVFGHTMLSDINSYRTEDTSLVFCDPWSGQVGKFNRKEVARKLGDYRYINLFNPDGRLNLVTSFNPDYHQLSIRQLFYLYGCRMQEQMENLFLTDSELVKRCKR